LGQLSSSGSGREKRERGRMHPVALPYPRIEPQTPPGAVYASRTFAALVAAERLEEFRRARQGCGFGRSGLSR
jgi:hypothetical protein